MNEEDDIERSFVARIGDFDDPGREWRRLFSELYGTFFLVIVVGGGGLTSQAFPNTISRQPAAGSRRARGGPQAPEKTVLAALDATTNAGNYDMAYVVHTTPATVPTTTRADNCTTVSSRDHRVLVSCSGGASSTQAVDVTGRGTVSLDPYAELTVSNVSGLGEITVGTNGTSVWEYGGADYGTTRTRGA